jgi:hypothetical protein
MICDSLSTEHGPATNARSAPPQTTLPMFTAPNIGGPAWPFCATRL